MTGRGGEQGYVTVRAGDLPELKDYADAPLHGMADTIADVRCWYDGLIEPLMYLSYVRASRDGHEFKAGDVIVVHIRVAGALATIGGGRRPCTVVFHVTAGSGLARIVPLLSPDVSQFEHQPVDADTVWAALGLVPT